MFTRKPKPILLFLFVAASLVLQACGVTTTAAPTETVVPTAAPTATTLPSPTPTSKPTATRTPAPAGAGRIPGGPILGSQAESEKAYDEKVPLLSEAATKSDKSTSGQETTTKYSVQVQRPDDKLIWATGWCASDPDTLTDNLKSIKFWGTVNGHPVDLNIASTIIGWAGDKRCKNISIVVSGWPEGISVLQYKLNVRQRINNGSGEIPDGTYIHRYEVKYEPAKVGETTGTATEVAAADISHIEGMPALLGQADTAKELELPDFAFLEDVADRSKFPVERHQVVRYFDSENIFVIRPPSKQKHLVWATGWCAADQATLDQNLENIGFEMSINNTPIDIGQFYSSEFQASGSSDYCRMYSLVAYDWPSGNTNLISKTVLNKSINNGHKTYPASEITRTYTVITP